MTREALVRQDGPNFAVVADLGRHPGSAGSRQQAPGEAPSHDLPSLDARNLACRPPHGQRRCAPPGQPEGGRNGPSAGFPNDEANALNEDDPAAGVDLTTSSNVPDDADGSNIMRNSSPPHGSSP
ncbi:MAG: hypothetical protein O3A87_03265, partial [Verrucomicrobia bacterium]|nr:hypothetical protein [Verrucomicrobiota bacterium]